MDHPLIDLIDRIVDKAQKDGAFDNLPGAGQPMARVDNPQNAVTDRIMRESGTKPPYVELRQRLAEQTQHLMTLTDPDARRAQMKVIADLQTRLGVEMDAMRRFG